MAQQSLVRTNLTFFKNRIRQISQESEAYWGPFSPVTVMCHMRLALDLSLPAPTIEIQAGWLQRVAFRSFTFCTWRRWPAGWIADAEKRISGPVSNLEDERAQLMFAMDKFVAALEANCTCKTRYGAFGSKRLEATALAHGEHLLYHFKQFGV